VIYPVTGIYVPLLIADVDDLGDVRMSEKKQIKVWLMLEFFNSPGL
jgi:hypothetical protein